HTSTINKPNCPRGGRCLSIITITKFHCGKSRPGNSLSFLDGKRPRLSTWGVFSSHGRRHRLKQRDNGWRHFRGPEARATSCPTKLPSAIPLIPPSVLPT